MITKSRVSSKWINLNRFLYFIVKQLMKDTTGCFSVLHCNPWRINWKLDLLGFELEITERNWKISSEVRKFRRRWFCRLTARTEYVQLWSNTLHDQVDPTAISVQFKLNSPSSIDFYNFNNSFQFQWFFQTKLKFFQLHSIQFHVGLSNFTFFNFSFFQLPFTTTHIVFVISLSFSVWEWRFSEKNILVEWLCFF